MLSKSKVTLSDINDDLPGLDHLLKHKQRLRQLWQETRDTACKTAVNWVTKSIRRTTRKKAQERWVAKIGNAEVTPQAMWPIAKSLLKKDGRKARTAIHGASGLKFDPSEKANAIAGCSHHMICMTKPGTAGGGLSSGSIRNRRQQPPSKDKTM
jgi:hypothetical protein